MTSVTPLTAVDLLDMNAVNLDALTENYYLEYYLEYMCSWPSLLFKTQTDDRTVGYMVGKSEGTGPEWHSHITAVTVEFTHRRLGLAQLLVDRLRVASDAPDQQCYFMDLYVRTSNRVAVEMYKRFGFYAFRRVLEYYGSGRNEDAFDMRMPLARDSLQASLRKSAQTVESPHYEYRYDAAALK